MNPNDVMDANTVRDTTVSDAKAGQWKDRSNPLKRSGVSFERTYRASAEDVFRLLCPTTEYDWVPWWSCELLHSASGYAEHNAVFVTEANGPREVWVCVRFEPPRAIEYARTAADYVGLLGITVTDNHDGTTTAHWVNTVSALNPAGNAVVEEQSSLAGRCRAVLDVMGRYLETGRMAEGVTP